MHRLRSFARAGCLLTAVVSAPTARAQGTEPPKVVTPALDFSGVIYAQFQRRSDSSAKALNGGNASSKFDVDRVYLTFRMPAGEHASIRVTTDIFNGDQSGTSFYKGWVARFKYAHVQWNFANDIGGKKGLNATARFGMLQTVVVDHEESFFPRFLSQTAIEKTAGFFASADLGAALLVTLPSKRGEIYTTITNGPGYTVGENDRFKDFAARLTLTPFANNDALGTWGKSIAISPWAYIGKTASKYQNAATGQVGVFPDGLKRNRYGLFIAAKDPRLTFGFDFAKGQITVEDGLNTVASPRTTHDSTSQIVSGFAQIRPGAFKDPKSAFARWGILGRLDNYKPRTDLDPGLQYSILSLFYEPTARLTFSLDQQTLSRKNGAKVPETKTLFLHMQATF